MLVSNKKSVKAPVKKAVKKVAKSSAKKIDFPKFKEVQETLIIRQGNYTKEKGAKKVAGFYIEYPADATEQVKEVVKVAGFINPRLVKLGHNESTVFLPKKDAKKVAIKENSKGAILRALKASFKYCSIVTIRSNGLVETKRIVEEEGKRSVAVKAVSSKPAKNKKSK